ncbi:hypothetical protein [Marivirga arenosa]|uniref:Signal transduction histidine kinase dimerisation/phosphoacceptor domain-containing protein n=1 Tax=Marivirga arenosa TaxID=3059076 RepID=A0AA52EYX3_9BACT|nr:hypothetical protein [Marivirga sp. BKB1-2]WNB18082.1 hypothetical protein QYS47_29160 [Marivirga sp. BKB1-2]
MSLSLKKWTHSGITMDMDDTAKRKLFLANVMALSLALVMIVVGLNDISNENYFASYRRMGVLIIMLFIPILNFYRYYRLSKSILLLLPSLILLGVPILIGDFFPGQFIWFQYAAAIFCSVPFIIFEHQNDRLFIILFLVYFLTITLFIDKVLLYYSNPPEAMKELVSNFTDFKIPPLFIALFSTTTFLWYNRTNAEYERKLKQANIELEETHEELIAKNEEYEAINRNLENLVKERSRLIETKNRQIIDYANINAHKVRGPLARIMGLINISEYSQEPEELKKLFLKLKKPSQELNEIIQEINKTLDQSEEGN